MSGEVKIKALAKLYRDPRNAQRALTELRKQSFADKEMGLLFKNGAQGVEIQGQPLTLTLPQVGECTALGPIAQIGSERPLIALAKLFNIDAEAADYYLFGLALGAVLVTVHADDSRLAQASRILKAADSLAVGETASPAFELSSYMTNTNPVDEKMTGDFRRY